MSNLTVLSSLEDPYVKDAALVLEDALEAGFKTVIVLGLKDEQIHIRSSKLCSKLALIGALDAAKMQLWAGD